MALDEKWKEHKRCCNSFWEWISTPKLTTTKTHGNQKSRQPSHSHQDISHKNTNVDLMMALQEKSGAHQS